MFDLIKYVQDFAAIERIVVAIVAAQELFERGVADRVIKPVEGVAIERGRAGVREA